MYKNIKVLILIITIIIFFLSKDIGIFWDNVLFISKMGGYLYEHNIFNWSLPDSIDPGHPPFTGFLNSFGWKLLGKKLWVSHLIMIPFIYGLLYQVFLLISYYVKEYKLRFFAFLLILADPTFLAHLFYVTPEPVQLFFFFLTINSILRNKFYLKTLGLSFLGIVSFRGMMLCAGIFIFDLTRALIINKKTLKDFLLNKEIIISYLIGAIPAVSFILWHYLSKGWIFTHSDSPWAGTNDFVDIKSFFFNLIVISHRYMDFGRVGIMMFIAIMLLFRYNYFKDSNIKELLLLAISSVLIIIIVSLSIVNPMGHRYFIASFIAFNLIAYLLLIKLKIRKILYPVLLTILISGNLWIYPETISQGWDSSLAGLPYFDLRREAINYLDTHHIRVKEVGTFFPNATSISNIDINNDDREFSYFNDSLNYVLYSNVYNLSDEEYDTLNKEYYSLKIFKCNKIHVSILQKKQN